MIDYGCRPCERGTGEPGLFFCGRHLSYGYVRNGFCHAVTPPSWDATRAWDGPILSPFTRRALARELPAKEVSR
jgi:hypothetical protein